MPVSPVHTHACMGSLFLKIYYSSPAMTKFRFDFIIKVNHTRYSFKRSSSESGELADSTPALGGKGLGALTLTLFVPVTPSVWYSPGQLAHSQALLPPNEPWLRNLFPPVPILVSHLLGCAIVLRSGGWGSSMGAGGVVRRIQPLESWLQDFTLLDIRPTQEPVFFLRSP